MGSFFRKTLVSLKRLFNMEQVVAGLEIKEAAIRIAQYRDNKLVKAAVLLEPGIIEDGEIRDRRKLVDNLKRLRAQFTDSKEGVPVILSIPSINVYAQTFSTPFLVGENLEEAAKLNLASISPVDLKTSYADWQRIGVLRRDNKIEMIGAFAPSAVVDAYMDAAVESGFVPVAVEFPALALSRAIKDLAAGINMEAPQVVLNVSSDGIDFIAMRHGNLYFNYFTPWKLIREEGRLGREILFSDFKDTIVKEIKKVVAFYGSHWEGRLEKLILVTQALDEEISGLIKENFPLEVIELKLREFSNLPPSWFGVLGSALRGKIPRSKDNLISLTRVGTEEKYYQTQVMLFVKTWRNVFLASLAFLALSFVLADSLLFRSAGQLRQQLIGTAVIPEGAEVLALKERALMFNQLVDKAFFAEERSIPRSPILIKIDSAAGGNVSLTRVFIDAERSAVLVAGRAGDQSTAVNFKNALVAEGFQNVSLPLSDIVLNQDRTVSFTITFSLGEQGTDS